MVEESRFSFPSCYDIIFGWDGLGVLHIASTTDSLSVMISNSDCDI